MHDFIGASNALALFMTRAELAVTLLMIFTVIVNSSSADAQAEEGVDSQCLIASLIPALTSPTTVSEPEYAELRYSPSVLRLARFLGLSSQSTFRLCRDLNFCLLLILVCWKGWPKVTAVLQRRSALIRQTIEDAQRLSVESRNRLAEIERRFAHLDSEIAALRARAEHEMDQEEQLLLAGTAEQVDRIMVEAGREIQAAVRRTELELRAFTAGLAVENARQSIRVDERTDQELISALVKGLEDRTEIIQQS